MKKNGFTLIELIAVVSLIIVLSLLITPKINGIIKENRKKSYKEMERRLEEAANKYIIQNYIDPASESITITKEQLINSNLIGEVYDLKDKSVCDASVLVTGLNSTPVYKANLNCANYVSE